MVADSPRRAPGSVAALYELKLALHEYIAQVVTQPLNSAVLHVDDTVLLFVGVDKQAVFEAAAEVERRARGNLAHIVVQLAEKEQLMATSADIVHLFCARTGRKEGTGASRRSALGSTQLDSSAVPA